MEKPWAVRNSIHGLPQDLRIYLGDKWLLRKVPTSLYKCDFTLDSNASGTSNQKMGAQMDAPVNSSLCLAIQQLGKTTVLVLSGAPLTRLASQN